MPAAERPKSPDATAADTPARIAALQAFLAGQPGAEAVLPPKGGAPLSLMFKIMGKMFAVLALRAEEFVVLKCDPAQAAFLRGHYAGVGKRTHLDPRHWIAVSLDADVPMDEIERLAAASYALVVAGLTKKQRAELGGDEIVPSMYQEQPALNAAAPGNTVRFNDFIDNRSRFWPSFGIRETGSPLVEGGPVCVETGTVVGCCPGVGAGPVR